MWNCFTEDMLSLMTAITRLRLPPAAAFYRQWLSSRAPLNGEVKQSWSKHDRALGQQWERTQGTSIYLSSQDSQSWHTWGGALVWQFPLVSGSWSKARYGHSSRPFILQDWIVALKIIWHWGVRQKTGRGRTYVRPDPESLFLFWNAALMPEYADLRDVNCLCVHSQVDRSLIVLAVYQRKQIFQQITTVEASV